MFKYPDEYNGFMEEGILEGIGMSKTEAKVYLTLNEIGSSTVNSISKKSKIFRSNIYDALERLMGRGLVSFTIKDNVKYYDASEPIHLINLIRDKEKQIIDLIPTLKLRKKFVAHEGSASITKGIPAVMNALYSLLEFREPIYVYGVPKEAPEMLRTKLPHFHKERIKRKIFMKHIYNWDAKERILFLNKLPYTEARYLDDKIKVLVATNICGDRVVLIHYTNPPLVITMDNKDIAAAYKEYFNVLYARSRTYS